MYNHKGFSSNQITITGQLRDTSENLTAYMIRDHANEKDSDLGPFSGCSSSIHVLMETIDLFLAIIMHYEVYVSPVNNSLHEFLWRTFRSQVL